jgi:adenine/guanine phosphoribosyltransferase-like PRPP-binding protein
MNTNKLEQIVKDISEFLSSQCIDFNSIAARGLSGTLVSSPVCIATGKSIVVVRKGESTHGYEVEADVCPSRYIIIDDFIDTGATIKAIINRISGLYIGTKCVGVVLYQQYIHDIDDQGIVFFDTSFVDDAKIAELVVEDAYRIKSRKQVDGSELKTTIYKRSGANHND